MAPEDDGEVFWFGTVNDEDGAVINLKDYVELDEDLSTGEAGRSRTLDAGERFGARRSWQRCGYPVHLLPDQPTRRDRRRQDQPKLLG